MSSKLIWNGRNECSWLIELFRSCQQILKLITGGLTDMMRAREFCVLHSAASSLAAFWNSCVFDTESAVSVLPQQSCSRSLDRPRTIDIDNANLDLIGE
jgi:hypothetical protein